ncbi:MAG: AAA family ATPase [Campylobacterota bacterium]|nr:AAA family ATPase [Campylobacterota bacterium]
MRLKLNNIGIIKEADITLDGLTVIAGENDSGKSTVGKVLYAIIKSIIKKSKFKDGSPIDGWCESELNEYILKLFNNQISNDGEIYLDYDNQKFDISIKSNRCRKFNFDDNYSNHESDKKVLFIDSPFIWNILTSLKAINSAEKYGSDIDFEVSELVKNLYLGITTKLKKDDSIDLNIESIIKGSFEEDNLGGYSFKKDNKKIYLANIAMGIKYFGILQVLSKNNHFYDGQILILDEPEVHLHPKWQLELAKVIVYLVSKGVKVLVNSHSPYMVEALQRYSKKQNIPNNFYLSDECKILEDDQALSKIFAKLSEPFDEFDKMDSETLNG